MQNGQNFWQSSYCEGGVSEMPLTLTILLYLVSFQSSKVTETNVERTCSRRRKQCNDDQTNQDPKDAKHTAQYKLGGLVSIAENWRDTEKSMKRRLQLRINRIQLG